MNEGPEVSIVVAQNILFLYIRIYDMIPYEGLFGEGAFVGDLTHFRTRHTNLGSF